MRSLSGLLVAVALVALAPAAPAEAPVTVTATNFQWSPAEIAIPAGGTVHFVNGGGSHNYQLETGGPTCPLPCTRTFPDEGRVDFRCGIHPSMRGLVLVGTRPTTTIATPSPGATVSGILHATGAASHPAHPIVAVDVRFATGPYVPATIGETAASVTWSVDVPTTAFPNGPQTLAARARLANGLHHEATVTVTLANPESHDLVLASLSSTASLVTPQSVSLHFSVRNDGNARAETTVTRLEWREPGDGPWRPVQNVTMGVIPRGEEEFRTIVWGGGFRHVGTFEVRALADASGRYAETDETNNLRHGQASFVSPVAPTLLLPVP